MTKSEKKNYKNNITPLRFFNMSSIGIYFHFLIITCKKPTLVNFSRNYPKKSDFFSFFNFFKTYMKKRI
jgi:hypothetical protein